MIQYLILAMLVIASPVFGAASVSVWTQDEFQKVKPNDVAGTGTAISATTPKLSYASGQIIVRCSDNAGSTTCTGADLTLPHLIGTATGLTIASTTNTAPVQVNFTTAHGLSHRAMLEISGTGIGALDGNVYYVTVVDSDSVTLDGTSAPGSTAVAGTAKHAIHKNNIVAYKGDTMHVFSPSAPPTLNTRGEFPWRLIPGMVGAEKKDPYYMETRTVFPVSIPTISKVYREWWPMPNVQHQTNINSPHNLLTNGSLARNLTGWTATQTGTGSVPSWITDGNDGAARLVGGASGTSKIEQCIPTFAGWYYSVSFLIPSGTGTVQVQVGSASGLADRVAKTGFTTTGQVEWAGADGNACVQFFGENASGTVKKIFLGRAISPDWTMRANPTLSNWTDVSSGGTVSWSSTNGGTLTLNGTGGMAAIEAQITVEANTTYVVYGNNSSINFQVGTSSGGTQIKASTALVAESIVSFTTGATSGTAYLRLTKSTAGGASLTEFYVTTGLSPGRITVSGTYNQTARKQYVVEITRSGGASTTPVGQFRYSDDGGATWSAATNIAASVAINNGLTLNFSNNFNDGERVTFYADSVRNQPFWLDIYADSSVPAGVYKGTATVITSSPVSSNNVPITVTVLPLTIPAENDYIRTYYALGELLLPSVHTGGSVQKELHKLYAKGCLRNHVTCGSNLQRYVTWNWDVATGAVTGISAGVATVNEIGKIFMDGVDTYGSLGIHTTPKGAKWTSFLFPRNAAGGSNPPTADTSSSYDLGSVSLAKYLNMFNDATYGWKARVLSCTTVGCDATNNHEDWADDGARNLVYGIDEPGLSTSLGSSETSVGQTFREFHDNVLEALPGYSYVFGTTKDLLRAGANDGPSVRGKWEVWFPIGANTTAAYGKTGGPFATDGLYATRQDYLDAGVTRIGVYEACYVNACTAANGLENVQNVDFRANTIANTPGPGTYDGYSRWTVDETMVASRLWAWQMFHWGRADYFLYYSISDGLDNYKGCVTGSGFYAGVAGRGQNNAADCVKLDESVFQFSGAGDGTYLYPALIADYGGTNDFVIETYQIKAHRQMIRDMTLLHIAWANARDGGTEVTKLVERGLISSTKLTIRDSPDVMRYMVRDLETLAARTVSQNRRRLTSYPRATTEVLYPKP